MFITFQNKISHITTVSSPNHAFPSFLTPVNHITFFPSNWLLFHIDYKPISVYNFKCLNIYIPCPIFFTIVCTKENCTIAICGLVYDISKLSQAITVTASKQLFNVSKPSIDETPLTKVQSLGIYLCLIFIYLLNITLISTSVVFQYLVTSFFVFDLLSLIICIIF